MAIGQCQSVHFDLLVCVFFCLVLLFRPVATSKAISIRKSIHWEPSSLKEGDWAQWAHHFFYLSFGWCETYDTVTKIRQIKNLSIIQWHASRHSRLKSQAICVLKKKKRPPFTWNHIDGHIDFLSLSHFEPNCMANLPIANVPTHIISQFGYAISTDLFSLFIGGHVPSRRYSQGQSTPVWRTLFFFSSTERGTGEMTAIYFNFQDFLLFFFMKNVVGIAIECPSSFHLALT